jgi:hypothetical protein
MDMNSLTKVFSEYGNKWVALTDNKQVIASANNLKQVLKMAKEKGYNNPLTALIPDPKSEYVL